MCSRLAPGVADLPGGCWNEDSNLSLLNSVPRHMSSRSRRYAHQPQPQSRVGPKPLMTVRERTNGQSGQFEGFTGGNGPPQFSSFDYTPGMLARSFAIYPISQRRSTRMVSCTGWTANNTNACYSEIHPEAEDGTPQAPVLRPSSRVGAKA